jgi:hypothetical protein
MMMTEDELDAEIISIARQSGIAFEEEKIGDGFYAQSLPPNIWKFSHALLARHLKENTALREENERLLRVISSEEVAQYMEPNK